MIIDNGTGGGNTSAVFVPDPATGGTSTISGLTIRSQFRAVLASRPVVIEGNVFDEGGPLTNPQQAHVQIFGSGSVVNNNDFSDPTPTPGQNQTGLSVGVAGPSEITDNAFSDLVQGISLGGDDSSTPVVSGNRIIGTRVGNNAGVGINVRAGEATITDNTLREPFFALPSDFVYGILIEPFPDGELGAKLARNVVLDHRFGIDVTDTTAPVTLKGDLVADSIANALRTEDDGADEAGVGDVAATNVTLVDTNDPASMIEAEALASGTELTLNSAIIGDKGISTSGSGTCEISFSRGPTTSGGSCEQFQTTANPLFVNSGLDDYHIQAASPMIDAGDPTPPPPGATDFDNDLRLLDGDGDCASIRDIGADEFEPAAPPVCPPPEALITKGPKPKSERRKPRFRFTTDPLQPGASFECRLDQKAYKPCTSPRKYGPLGAGSHIFRVRASEPTDGQGPADKLKFKILP